MVWAVALLTLSPLVPGPPLLPFVPGSPRRPLENTESGHINRMPTWIPTEVTLGCPAFSLLAQETSPCPLKESVPGSRAAGMPMMALLGGVLPLDFGKPHPDYSFRRVVVTVTTNTHGSFPQD